MTKKRLITLTGPSGTGKSRMADMMKERGLGVQIVTCTTRPPRAGEIDGQHYHFISMDEFVKREARGEFIESARFGKDGHVAAYGAARADAELAFAVGKPVIFVCEPEGTQNIHAYAQVEGWECTRVFLDNPMHILAKRFLERFVGDKSASLEKYAGRMTEMFTTEREMWVAPAHDGRHPYELVVNEFTPETEVAVMNAILEKAGVVPAKKSRKALNP